MKDLHAKIRSGSAVAMLANLVYLISRIAITPFILSYVSLAAYGLWAFCFVVLSYAGMSAFGIHNSYIKYTAEYFHAQEYQKINGLFSTGLAIMGAYSIVFFIILIIASPWIIGLFDIEADHVPLATSLLIGTASVFLIDLTLGAFRAILEGMQEIAVSKAIWLVTTLLELVLIILFLRAGTGLMGVMYAYIIKTIVDVVAHIVAAYRFLPSLHIALSMVSKQYYHELFVFGGKVQVLGLLGMFLGSLDRILITAMFGLHATGLYELGRKLPFTARSITGAASAPFLPAASAMKGTWKNANGQMIEVHEAISTSRKYLNTFWNYFSLAVVTTLGGIISLIVYILSKNYLEKFFLTDENNNFVMLFYEKILNIKFYSADFQAFFTTIKNSYAVQLVFLILSAMIFAVSIASCIKQYYTVKNQDYYDASDLSKLYIQASRYINMINGLIYGFIMATAPQLLYAWLGKGYDSTHRICLIVGLMCVVHLATLPCSAMMRGINRSGRELEAIIINVVLFIIWAPVLSLEYNFMGIVWAFAVSTIVSSVFFILRTNSVFRVHRNVYIKECIYPVFFPAIIAIIITCMSTMAQSYLENFNRWETLILLSCTGAIYTVVSLTLFWFHCLNTNERNVIIRILKKKA